MIQVTLDVGTLFPARQSVGSDTADHAGKITQNSRICAAVSYSSRQGCRAYRRLRARQEETSASHDA